jgi:hypothetical protein
MGKYLIAIATVIVFFQGGSGTPQQPFGNLQAIQSHRALLGGPPTHYKILYSFQGGADGARAHMAIWSPTAPETFTAPLTQEVVKYAISAAVPCSS